ncbi:MAG: hypothetical protein KF886_20230 [Candidatus Hydrogenedentes bacterium]|nr:hypothetical protein [Candidatus Hydrogenedentota bacterium]
MTYFDVKKVTTTATDLPDTIGSRSINLMCAILKGIPYNTLYNTHLHTPPTNPPSSTLLDTLIDNVSALPPNLDVGATENNPIVKSRLVGTNGALVRIRDEAVRLGYPRLKLKKLFYINPDAEIETPQMKLAKFIISELENVHKIKQGDNGDQMYHFCVPFLTFQKGRKPPHEEGRPRKYYPEKNDLEYFLAKLGDLEMEDLYGHYRSADYDGRRKAARKALERCVLKEYRPKDTRPKPGNGIGPDGSDGNSRYCAGAGSGCRGCDHPDDWCNDYEQDGKTYCSLGSDYH